ncbi:MAG: tRNA (guanosine(37)-N1)-methyltransferase TrmD [Eubacterium sp.]|nr:tRNA (guanosine(37)-N1)-methyltransferase TrmD [Eubacterium sp.]
MRFHVLTLFPEMIENVFKESVTGRALEKGIVSLETINIRDFANNKYKHVDDYIYGGGSGMLMQAEPVFLAFKKALENAGITYDEYFEMIKNNNDEIEEEPSGNDVEQESETKAELIIEEGETAAETDTRRKPRVLYMSPQGRTFSQSMAEELSAEEDVIILCGHYEGIDERAIELIKPEEVSIGDFVLTGGELAASIIMDSVTRLLPGALGSDDSAVYESFYDGLLEYPQYTRPEEYMGLTVPPVLLSGHHKNIENWRHEQALERTKEKRPDLYEKYMELHPPKPDKKRKKKV